jgi:hypothetical protein
MRKLLVVVAVLMVVGLVVNFANAKRDEGPRGNSNVIQLNLELWDAAFPELVVSATPGRRDSHNCRRRNRCTSYSTAKGSGIPSVVYVVKSGGSGRRRSELLRNNAWQSTRARRAPLMTRCSN